MNVVQAFKATIKKHSLINQNDRILVALSGGADSVTLLHLLYMIKDDYNLTIGAAHINHSLRETADRDMYFCENLCKSMNIPIHTLIKDIKTEAKKNGQSEELYARKVRYDFFASLCYDKIATAHNKNDNAETILFNFMRGSSLGGLSGIPYSRDNIIRPLLDIKKSDIIDFCNSKGFEFVTDETNLVPVYTRNKIRLGLIPKIEKNFNPNFINVVSDNSILFSQDSDYLLSIAEKEFKGEILTDFTNSVHPAILRRMIEIYYKKVTGNTQNLSGKYILDIINLMKSGKTGKKIDLPDNFEAYISYGRLIIEAKGTISDFSYEIKPETPLFVKEINKTVVLSQCENGDIFLKDTENLVVRNRRKGDIFYPTDMTGKKRLSDYFTDKKIPVKERNLIPILTKNDKIVSVIGYRNDRNFQNADFRAYKIIIKET